MGDMGDVFKDMQDAKKERHASWKEQNTKILEESGLQFRSCNNGETLLFKEPKQAEFFPSTGRWKAHNPKRVLSGGAKRFLEWLKG